MAIFLSEQDVTDFLDIKSSIDVVEESLSLFNKGEAFNTVRTRSRIRKGALHILPSALPSYDVMGYKAYTSFRAGLRFLFYLHSATTGELLAVIEALELSRIRTAAASAVAAKYLSNENAPIFTIFGAGYQAQSQLEAMLLVRDIKKIYVIGRDPVNTEKFIDIMSQKTSQDILKAEDVRSVLKESDIITTVTTASKPLFDKTYELKDNVHINAVGSNSLIRQELNEHLLENSIIIVDSIDVALKECGDILPLLEKGRLHKNSLIELGDIINGKDINKNLRTIFESQGMGLWDLSCANYVYNKALAENKGQKLPF